MQPVQGRWGHGWGHTRTLLGSRRSPPRSSDRAPAPGQPYGAAASAQRLLRPRARLAVALAAAVVGLAFAPVEAPAASVNAKPRITSARFWISRYDERGSRPWWSVRVTVCDDGASPLSLPFVEAHLFGDDYTTFLGERRLGIVRGCKRVVIERRVRIPLHYGDRLNVSINAWDGSHRSSARSKTWTILD